MQSAPLFRSPKNAPSMYGCQVCFDYGIVILVERIIVGITDLMENSMPCTCSAGDQWKAEYARKVA